MPSSPALIETISKNNSQVDRFKVRSVLIIYEDQHFFIGDSCIILDKLKICWQFFSEATVTLNFLSAQHIHQYKALLKNNPYISRIDQCALEMLDIPGYDLVICIVHDERKISKWLQEKYGHNGLPFTTAVYSFSQVFFPHIQQQQIAFQPYLPLLEFAGNATAPKELYISQEERSWAAGWLQAQGLKEEEQLLIILDTTTRKDKLLSLNVYYELILWLLTIPDSKILIFDERNTGKAFFYRELLGEQHFHKFIFSQQLGLRQDLCLVGSGRAKLVFGPCTGLMHCASAIYNHYVNEGLPLSQVPVMITYTGKNHQPPYYWWNNSPLMDVLVLMDKNGRKEMALLKDMDDHSLHSTHHLSTCNNYTASMLIQHMSSKLDGIMVTNYK